MKLFQRKKINDNKYAVQYILNGSAVKYFDDFTEMLAKTRAVYDTKTSMWIVDKCGFEAMEALERRLFPPVVTPKMPSLSGNIDMIAEQQKEITGWEDMGEGLKLKPYAYQKQIIKYCVDNGCGLIVAPCGAGKTPCAIAIFDELKKRGVEGPGMIVVKASLKVQWAAEIKKFSDYKPSIIQTEAAATKSFTQKRKRLEKKLKGISDPDEKQEIIDELNNMKKDSKEMFLSQFKDADLFICNYETLNDTAVRKEIHRSKLQFVFSDEIHYAKSASAKRSKSLCEFNFVKYRFGATATPLQRDPRDIFGIFKFVAPSEFPSARNFNALYLKYGFGGRPIGATNQKLLNKHIAPYMIIKTKEEVAKQLPSLVVTQRWTHLTDAQQEVHDTLMAELDELHEQEKNLRGGMNEYEQKMSQELQKIDGAIMMRQTFAQELADSEELLMRSDSESAKRYVTKTEDNKLNLLIDTIEEILESGEKVCVFSRYATMQDVITERIESEAKKRGSSFAGVKIAYVNGKLNGEQRSEEVYDKFRDTDEYKILLMSDAGAEGLNLSKAKFMIEYEPASSYAIQTQRHGRLERADSVHDTVHVIQLRTMNSWDDIAARIVEKKEAFDLEIVKGQTLEK